ncbi:hypothetical protein [Pseudooceanicola sp.]|uniref:hypothetical protein n=1 Tax=Pseudooceanicola sp. TaxID=1914328 RepID=UPI00351616C3
MPHVAAFVAGAIGAAAPAIGAATFGTYVAGAGFATFLSTTVVGKLLTTVAVSALSVALQSAPKTPSDPGIRTEQTMTGGTTPASFILGKFATEGQLVAPPMSYRQEGDIPNSLLVYVIELGDIPGQTLEGMIIDGEPVTIGDTLYTDALGTTHGYPIEGKHDGYAWVTYYDGTQTTADQRLVDHFGSDPERPWSTDMVGEGICYAVVTFRINRKLYSGFPKVRFIMGGIPLYDPRKDSTVGGSGSHRWNDSATWEPSENNAVQAYNILRGITLPGGEVWGGDMDADDLPLSNWFAAMNAADASIEATDGVFEPTYRSSYEVFVSDEPASVIEELMKAASGQLAEIGGVWKVRLGGPGLPVFFFSDDDVNIRESQSFEPFPGVGEIYNGVHASYPDPDSAWNPNDAPPRYNASYEADDGDRRLVADLTLPAAPYANQVQRLMVAYIEEERRMRRHTLTLAPEAIPLEPLDSVSWTSVRNGYTSKVFEVAKIVDPLLTSKPQMVLRERDPGDYDWAPEKALPNSTTSLTVTPPVNYTVWSWAVSAVTLKDDSSADRRPAIKIVWNAANNDDIAGIAYKVRLASSSVNVTSGTDRDGPVGEAIVEGPVLPSTTYQVKIKFISVSGREADWTHWENVTTGKVRLGEADLEDAVTGSIQDAVDTADQVKVDFDDLVGNFAGTLEDLEVDAAAAQQAALDSEAAKSAAEAARDNAQSSAGSAAGSASAAAGSASAAASSESNAASSASAAAASVLTARAGVATTFPPDLRDSGVYFTRSGTGLAPAPVDPSEVVEVAGIGPVWERTGFAILHPMGYLPAVPGAVYEFAAEVRATADNTVPGASENLILGAVSMDEDGDLVSYHGLTALETTQTSHSPLRVVDGWVTLRGRYTVPASPSFAYMRPRLYYGFTGGGEDNADGTWQVRYYPVRDVTSQAGAESAQSSAEFSETNAVQAKNDAEGASASAVSARDLAVSAGGAAELAAMRLLPSDFQEDGRYFTSTSGGAPGANPVSGAWDFKDVAGEGRVIYAPAAQAGKLWLMTAGLIRPVVGRTYRLTVRADLQGSVSGSPDIALFFRALDESYSNVTAHQLTSFDITFNFENYVIEFTPASEIAYLRPGFYLQDGLTGSGEFRASVVLVEDVTESKSAAGSAAAASSSHTEAAAAAATATSAAATATSASNLSVTAKDQSETARDASVTARGLSEDARDAAQTAQGAAEDAQSAAETARSGAETAQAAAGVSETNAAQAKFDAETASAAAISARDVTARILGSGANSNPIFLDWDGAAPAGYSFYEAEGSATKRTDGEYGNAVRLSSAASPTANSPRLVIQGPGDLAIAKPENLDGIGIDLEVAKVSGLWNNGARVYVSWIANGTGGNTVNESVALGPHLEGTNGLVQLLQLVFFRPDDFAPGSLDSTLRVRVEATSDEINGYGQVSFDVHRLSEAPITSAAQASIQQKALADLQGNALAQIVMRVKTPGAVATVEMVAGDDVEGNSASKVRMTGDEIEFDGLAVFADGLESDDYVEDVQGFRLDATGLDMPQGVIRGFLADEAVTDHAEASNVSGRKVGSDSDPQQAYIRLGPVDYDTYWKLGFVTEIRGQESPLGSTYITVRMRTYDGSWSGYTTIYQSSPVNNTNVWGPEYFFYDFVGKYDDVEFEINVIGSLPEASLAHFTARRTYIVARSNTYK